MRNRTLDSTTPSSPLDSNDSWVWFITEKGLRASGATSMKAAAAELRQTAAELEKAARRLGQDITGTLERLGRGGRRRRAVSRPNLRRDAAKGPSSLTVCGQYRDEHQVPSLRLAGKWLRQAGFGLGQKVQIRVDQRQLTICAE